METTLKLALLAAAIVAVFAFLDAGAGAARQAACLTDSECMRLCPANDARCDGGPQS